MEEYLSHGLWRLFEVVGWLAGWNESEIWYKFDSHTIADLDLHVASQIETLTDKIDMELFQQILAEKASHLLEFYDSDMTGFFDYVVEEITTEIIDYLKSLPKYTIADIVGEIPFEYFTDYIESEEIEETYALIYGSEYYIFDYPLMQDSWLEVVESVVLEFDGRNMKKFIDSWNREQIGIAVIEHDSETDYFEFIEKNCLLD